MAEKKQHYIVIACSVIGCIVTLLTCGIVMGRVQSNVIHNANEIMSISEKMDKTISAVSEIKEEQAFQRGVVNTQLTTQGAAIVRIEKKLDDLVKVD